MNIKSSNILSVGEILWDVLPEESKPGGAPMNAALHLHKLGKNVAFASRVGNDQAGTELVRFIQKVGISAHLMQRDDTLPTSKVIVTLDEKNDATYEIVEPVAWDNLEITPVLHEEAANAGIIIYGTLASRNEKSRNAILGVLDYDNLKCIDVNLRPPYDKREVIDPLLRKADIAKFNEEELHTVASFYGYEQLSEKEIVQRVAHQYGHQIIMVSKGSEGAVLYANNTLYTHNGYAVKTVDTIGAGDGFLAGMVSAIIDQKSPREILNYACATGAFVASKAGGTPDYNMEEIYTIMTNG